MAHAHHEQRDREENSQENRKDDVDGDGENGHHRDHQKIEQHQAAMMRLARTDAAHERNRPRIDVLNRNHHDGGREHDTRHLADDRE